MKYPQYWLWVLLCLITFAYQQCPGTQISCHGMCVDSSALCAVDMVCPGDLQKINLYSCALTNDFATPSKCDTFFECWDGTCQAEQTAIASKCPTMITCPISYNVRCPDNSCVQSIEECPNYFNCPSFIPIRCPNGDCRNSLEDCPSLLKCPNAFTMQCNDTSCRLTSEDCDKPSIQTQCIDQSMTRCPDGTCTSAKFLCPTPKTCNQDYVKCWNGLCALEGKCQTPASSQSSTCSSTDLIVCAFDNSCRKDISLCPTGWICPVDKPVKCWDMSCKESVSSCPPHIDCPTGATPCPDGSCTNSSCGTHITCSLDAPFKCYDNTCRRNPADCPTPPSCPSEFPMLCWDGRCLADRGDCLPPEECQANTPVKCPDNMCRKTSEECKIVSDCPTGFSRCPDGHCRKKIADCQNSECPLSFPYRCNNGLCVSNASHCDLENGCPFNKPVKCLDGECVIDEILCAEEVVCEKDTRLCPDGSCLPFAKTCPAENGCPTDTPQLCADGTCIDSRKATCAIPACPAETPVRCIDGTCAITISSCPDSEKSASKDDLVVCADGIEAHFFEECKPLLSCSAGQERCPDGSCRELEEYCPKAKTCPDNQIRCSNGSCAESEDLCFNLSGCHKKAGNKCPNSGWCVEELDQCTTYEEKFNLSNGCKQEFPIKCSSGKCVALSSDCPEKNECELENKVKCNSGECVDRARDCKSAECLDGYVTCPNDATCMSSYGNCLNSFNCKLDTPFRCLNGACRRYPSQSSAEDTSGCEMGIKCPEYKPFLCADGQCVEKSTFCKSLTECPEDKPHRCFDRTCYANENECLTSGLKCPSKNPIKCLNNNCVSNFFDCMDVTCPSWKPYKCSNGLCKTAPRDCLEQEDGTHRSLCNENEYTCYDGSCRRNESECPIYPGCPSSALPYKCIDGNCATKEEECEVKEIMCPVDTTLCMDGICRKQCPHYNGCTNEKPLMCSTGRCVETISECVGEGNCINIDTPFRCIDGSCASSISGCKSNFRSYGTTNAHLSVYPQIDISTDIIIGENNSILGSIYVPSDTFIKNGKSTSTTWMLKSLPRDTIYNTFSRYNETRQEDISKVFPYADPDTNYTLEFEYTLLSSALSIEISDSDVSFRNFLLLTLAYDFPQLHETILNDLENDVTNNDTTTNLTTANFMTLDPLLDVCLARLQGQEWTCVDIRSKTESLATLQLQGAINLPGIYAVILSPRKNTTPLNIASNFIIENLKILAIIFVIVLIILGAAFYFFLRFYRYRQKYKETQAQANNLNLEMKAMDQSTTDVAGQTIGDRKEGVIYTDNPCFKLVRNENDSQRVIQLKNIHKNYQHKLKVLERNNDKLKSSWNHIMEEHDRLTKYKEELINKEVSTNTPIIKATEKRDDILMSSLNEINDVSDNKTSLID